MTLLLLLFVVTFHLTLLVLAFEWCSTQVLEYIFRVKLEGDKLKAQELLNMIKIGIFNSMRHGIWLFNINDRCKHEKIYLLLKLNHVHFTESNAIYIT
jgi:hypothetical protein